MKTWQILLLIVLFILAIMLFFYMRQSAEKQEEIEQEILNGEVQEILNGEVDEEPTKPDVTTMQWKPGVKATILKPIN